MLLLFLCIPLSMLASDLFPIDEQINPPDSGHVWYCDPVNGVTPTAPKDAARGDGSKERPWGSLESVIKARYVNGADSTKGKIHAGDTIKLMSGDHGRVSFQSPEYQCTSDITVEAADGESPTIQQVAIKFARNWTFRGITFQPPTPTEGTDYSSYMLFRGTEVSGFTIDQCRFQSVEDATVWGDAEWETRCCWFGVWISGTDLTITNNQCYALENCIAIDSGRDIVVDSNRVELFLNDGIQHCASNLRITRNRITDQYNLASNLFHHDGIQGWSNKGIHQRNVVIDSNFVARSTGKYKSIPPISSAVFQGISIFDGAFSEVTISNNVVMATASHGISLYGCTDSTIERNTVIYQGMTPLKPCWIGVFTGKPKWGAVQPSGIVVRSNIAPTYAMSAVNSTTPHPGIELDGNFSFKVPGKPYQARFVVVDPAKTFVKYCPESAAFDLNVQPESPAARKAVTTWTAGAGARQ
jgi:parallel beta-helix repeat protein